MSNTHEITFKPNPMQKRFIESRAKADLFSSRMGEGKSAAICWSVLYHTRHNPGANHVILRDTWENLQATTMQEFFKWFPPGVAGTFHWTQRKFTWASGLADGTVSFLGGDDPQDASKLMSREIAGICIDEPSPAVGSAGVDELVFDIAMSRLRQPNMKWYMAKLAENNPDEAHWTYRRFVRPGTEGFMVWQPPAPENTDNLPDSYYADLRKMWAHRPDLVRRFVEGEFGFQQDGKSVTPQWSDRIHLATGLYPMKGRDLYIGWDFGHNPTCVITQMTPLGFWHILDAVVGDDIGAEELIENAVRPLLIERYKGYKLRHIGDPAGNQREQTSIKRSAVRAIKASIGGTWKSGPVKPEDRIEPMRSALGRTINGVGMVQVDRDRATPIWHALRGGWAYPVSRAGIIGGSPKKDIHSHPGDAISYIAAILFPLGRLTRTSKDGMIDPKQANYFGSNTGPLGFERPYAPLPKEGMI